MCGMKPFSLNLIRHQKLVRAAAFLGILLLGLSVGIIISLTSLGEFDPTDELRARLDPISGTTIQGEMITLNFHASDRTVLFVFDPRKEIDETSFEHWNEIAESFDHNTSAVGIATSTSQLAECLTRNQPRFPVISSVSKDTLWQHGIQVTPLTVIVKKGGSVAEAWFGTLQDRTVRASVWNFLEQPVN